MTEREIIIDEAAKRIAEAQKQRDKARRELSRAKSIIRELLRQFTADVEAEEGEYDGDKYIGLTPKSKAFEKALRFVDGRK